MHMTFMTLYVKAYISTLKIYHLGLRGNNYLIFISKHL